MSCLEVLFAVYSLLLGARHVFHVAIYLFVLAYLFLMLPIKSSLLRDNTDMRPVLPGRGVEVAFVFETFQSGHSS